MDLGAHLMQDILLELLPSEPPRLRGIRLMALEDQIDEPVTLQDEMFNDFCGRDVIYIHTRCGQCNFDGNDNFETCGMKDWEIEHADLFIYATNDCEDCTYRDTYIKIPKDKMELYKQKMTEILSLFNALEEE